MSAIDVNGGADRGGAVRRLWALLLSPRATWVLIAALAVLYVVAYGVDGEQPFHDGTHRGGWWTWTDQGLYLRSARAFAEANLSSTEHWYPMGYPLLGVPFVHVWPDHPFFVVDLAFFLAAAVLFARICEHFEVPRNAALLLFAAALVGDYRVFREWLVPWSTTPVVVYVHGLLLIAITKRTPSRAAIVVAAVCAALTAVTRPSDALFAVPFVVVIAARCFAELSPREAVARLLPGALVGTVILAAYAALHVSVYGFALSEYMINSRNVGFDFHDFGLKLYALVIDPVPLWFGGDGMAHRAPWIALALPGLVIGAHRFGWRWLLVCVVVVVDFAIYTSYADTMPLSLWRFNSVHYFKIAYPLLALAATVAVMAALRDRRVAIGVVVAVLLVFSVRLEVRQSAASVRVLDPRRLEIDCAACGTFRALRVAPLDLPFDDVYLTPVELTADGTVLPNLRGCRFASERGGLTIVLDRREPYRDLVVSLSTASNLSPVVPLEASALDFTLALAAPRLPGW